MANQCVRVRGGGGGEMGWHRVLYIRKFSRKFYFSSSVKTHICDVENSRQGRDLPISVNDSVISPIRDDFIFTKLRMCEVSRK